MAAHEDALLQAPRQDERPADARDRARRLYANARLLEDLCPNERAKEIARDVALMAMDLLAEARASA